MAYVVINAITVPGGVSGAGKELERRFAARAGEVDKQPGFLGFKLLRPADDRETYYVFTEWNSKQEFEAWRDSRDFTAGHAHSAAGGPVASGSEVLLFEVV